MVKELPFTFPCSRTTFFWSRRYCLLEATDDSAEHTADLAPAAGSYKEVADVLPRPTCFYSINSFLKNFQISLDLRTAKNLLKTDVKLLYSSFLYFFFFNRMYSLFSEYRALLQ